MNQGGMSWSGSPSAQHAFNMADNPPWYQLSILFSGPGNRSTCFFKKNMVNLIHVIRRAHLPQHGVEVLRLNSGFTDRDEDSGKVAVKSFYDPNACTTSTEKKLGYPRWQSFARPANHAAENPS
jgi:hypothetical protein